MLPLFTSAQSRELDQLAIAGGIPAYTLMNRAGAALFRVLREKWPDTERIAILCGAGNNGGDGYVCARLARDAGLDVRVFQLGDPQALRGDAARAAAELQSTDVSVRAFDAAGLDGVDLLIDAMLGTGVNRPVEGLWADAIRAANHCPAPVLAVDIPSGLSADTGMPLGSCIRAACTVSFIGRKQGLFTGHASEFCGVLEFDDLEVPAKIYDSIEVVAELLVSAPLGHLQAPRPRYFHKGNCGHVLVVGGQPGMAGAVQLAAAAAARVGAGLVSIATSSTHASVISASRPELMCHGVECAQDLQPLLDKATVVAVGPGLGRSAWARQMLGSVLDSRHPLIVDADALNLLAESPQDAERGNWVLTPHPGEAGRLLSWDTHSVQQDRFTAVSALVERYGGIGVLKGAGTLIAEPGRPIAICNSGNPGMASGGMGDVLTGVIAGLLAQGLTLANAAKAGVYIHGAAADLAASAGERGLLASDVLAHLRSQVNP